MSSDQERAIERAASLFERARRPVSFTGAGLSAESGVPTFRDADGAGEWEKHDPMTLASAAGFEAQPDLVLRWYAHRRRRLATARPNPAHHALASVDMPHVTQNVDDLLIDAGVPPHRLIRLHGTIREDRCHGDVDAACLHREAADGARAGMRRCPRCGGRMRPAVVWFGEALDADTWRRAEEACTTTDLLLVVGTSAAVFPAAGLIDLARSGAGGGGSGARVVVVNPRPTAADHLADVLVVAEAGAALPRIVAAGTTG